MKKDQLIQWCKGCELLNEEKDGGTVLILSCSLRLYNGYQAGGAIHTHTHTHLHCKRVKVRG